jgi:histidinol-phosphate aminotransferase
VIDPNPKVARFDPALRRERPRIGRVHRLGHGERTVPLPDDVVRAALASIAPEELTAIPELERFYGRLVEYLGVQRDCVLACAGADAGIAMLFQAYARPGDTVIRPEPTYHRYAELASLYETRQIVIGYDEQLRPDLDALRAAISSAARLVIVVNPCNPTGSRIELAEIAELAERCQRNDALLLVDEAYFHFCDVTAVPLIDEFDNLVVARSFSKAFGLAGVRVGAIAGSRGVIAQLAKLKPRHEISAVSARIAEALLDRPDVVEAYVEQSRIAQQRLAVRLSPHGFTVIPGESSSVMVRLPDGLDARELAARLLQSNFEIASGFPEPLHSYMRVAVGPPDQAELFADAVIAATTASAPA